MKLLFTGRGSAGSWKIRGEQLGRALGAVIDQAPTVEDCRRADVVVVVKKVREETLAAIRKSGSPWVYDALDCYPQPGCSAWTRDEAVGWLRHRIGELRPNGVIWPNRRMGEDAGVTIPSMTLPHHFRPGIHRNPIRETVKRLGYEGAPAYIERWLPAIKAQCAKRGWEFVVNPTHLADVDIVLAVRGGAWDCYATRHWKSNVKLANAHGSGTPFIGQRECGYLESSTGREYWANEPASLAMCFDWLTPQSTRQLVAERFLEAAYPVDRAAEDLKGFIDAL